MKSIRIVVATLCCFLATLVVAGEPEAKQSPSLTSPPNSRETELRTLLSQNLSMRMGALVELMDLAIYYIQRVTRAHSFY